MISECISSACKNLSCSARPHYLFLSFFFLTNLTRKIWAKKPLTIVFSIASVNNTQIWVEIYSSNIISCYRITAVNNKSTTTKHYNNKITKNIVLFSFYSFEKRLTSKKYGKKYLYVILSNYVFTECPRGLVQSVADSLTLN